LLSPNKDPAALGVLIRADYKGDMLRVWRFRLQPNYDDFVAIAQQQTDTSSASE